MNLFSYIKNQIPILDLAGSYTKLAKAGLYWKGCCPIHNEKTGSFTVSPHKEIFYCFGCNEGGDVITLVAKMENCNPIEAAKLLIERYQLTLPQDLQLHQSTSESEHQKKRYTQVCSLVARWCHSHLLKTPSLLAYLSQKGISQESIEAFELGYFPGGPRSINSCIAFAQKHSVLPEDLIKAHIVAQGKNILYSPFEERIIFPIKNHLGHHCGFGGRIYKAHDTRAKYYNSRESEQFIKGSLLFGFDRAKKAIQKEDKAFLVEGYTDCITMVQHGYHNTIATLGTACTPEHLKILARYAGQLFVVYDADHAGKDAILRLTELCWNVNLELYVVRLPTGEDPASFLLTHKTIDPLIEQAIDIFSFFIQELGTNSSQKSLAKKLHAIERVISIIKTLDNPLKQGILLQQAAAALEIPLESLQASFNQKPVEKKVFEKKIEKVALSEPLSEISLIEKKIFFAIIHNIELFNGPHKEYLLKYLPFPLATLLEKLHQQQLRDPSLDFAQFFELLNQKEQHHVARLTVEFNEIISENTFEDLMTQWQRKNWKHMIHSIKTKLEHAREQHDETTIALLMQEFISLKEKCIPHSQRANRGIKDS